MRSDSSFTFLAAKGSSDSILSRSTTTTPSASPRTKSPGWTVTPPTVTGCPMRPGTSLVGPFGLVPTLNTG